MRTCKAYCEVIGGACSGFFGAGGAFVAPPMLTAFFGLRQLETQGLALALVSPSAFLALRLMPGPVRLIGLSDYRLHLVASRQSPLASRSPADCPRDECDWRSADSCCYRGSAGAARVAQAEGTRKYLVEGSGREANVIH